MSLLETVNCDEVYLPLYDEVEKVIAKVKKYPATVTTFKTAHIVLTLIQNERSKDSVIYPRTFFEYDVEIMNIVKGRVLNILNHAPTWLRIFAVFAGFVGMVLVIKKYIVSIVCIITTAVVFFFIASRLNILRPTLERFYEYLLDQDHSEKAFSINLSLKESILLSLYEASQQIADTYIRKGAYDSILVKANIEVIRSGKLFQYETEEIEIIRKESI